MTDQHQTEVPSPLASHPESTVATHSTPIGRASETTPTDGTAEVQPCDCSEGGASPFGALWSDAPPFDVSWGSVSCQSHVGPVHNGHGTYVYCLSPSGDVSALAVNEKKAKNTRVLFFSSLTPGELSTTVYPTEEDKKTGR